MTDFPSIKDDLRPRPALKRHAASAVTDEEVEANSVAVARKWGVAARPPETPAVPRLPEPARVVSIRGYIPDYLDDELALKAAQRRVTKTFLVLEALAKAGYRVDEIDIVQDRRKRPKGT